MSGREDEAGRCAALLVVQVVRLPSGAAGTTGSFREAGAGGVLLWSRWRLKRHRHVHQDGS